MIAATVCNSLATICANIAPSLEYNKAAHMCSCESGMYALSMRIKLSEANPCSVPVANNL